MGVKTGQAESPLVTRDGLVHVLKAGLGRQGYPLLEGPTK